MVTYDQMTLTERAEAHVLAARMLLGQAQANLQQSAAALVEPSQQQLSIAAAQALWTGAQAEATLANACALLAANQSATREVGTPAKLETKLS